MLATACGLGPCPADCSRVSIKATIEPPPTSYVFAIPPLSAVSTVRIPPSYGHRTAHCYVARSLTSFGTFFPPDAAALRLPRRLRCLLSRARVRRLLPSSSTSVSDAAGARTSNSSRDQLPNWIQPTAVTSAACTKAYLTTVQRSFSGFLGVCHTAVPRLIHPTSALPAANLTSYLPNRTPLTPSHNTPLLHLLSLQRSASIHQPTARPHRRSRNRSQMSR